MHFTAFKFRKRLFVNMKQMDCFYPQAKYLVAKLLFFSGSVALWCSIMSPASYLLLASFLATVNLVSSCPYRVQKVREKKRYKITLYERWRHQIPQSTPSHPMTVLPIHTMDSTASGIELFLDALASLAFKLSVTELLSHTFSDMQSLQSVQSLQSQESLQSLQLESIQPIQSMRSIHHCTQQPWSSLHYTGNMDSTVSNCCRHLFLNVV